MRVFAVLVCASVLTGCAESSVYQRTLETQGALSVAPGVRPGEYVVTMRNLVDVGMNLNDKADRDRVALSYLKAQCPSGRVIAETPIKTGEYLLGNPAITYALTVNCAG